MNNYVIERTYNGKTESLNTVIRARTEREAIVKAFDLARIVTGQSLPVDGVWKARLDTPETYQNQ